MDGGKTPLRGVFIFDTYEKKSYYVVNINYKRGNIMIQELEKWVKINKMAIRIINGVIKEMRDKTTQMEEDTEKISTLLNEKSNGNPFSSCSEVTSKEEIPEAPDAEIPEAPKTPEIPEPRVTVSKPEVDVYNVPYDARIHSATKSKISDGGWRKKRGVSLKDYNTVMNEICPSREEIPEAPDAEIPKTWNFGDLMNRIIEKKISEEQLQEVIADTGLIGGTLTLSNNPQYFSVIAEKLEL